MQVVPHLLRQKHLPLRMLEMNMYLEHQHAAKRRRIKMVWYISQSTGLGTLTTGNPDLPWIRYRGLGTLTTGNLIF